MFLSLQVKEQLTGEQLDGDGVVQEQAGWSSSRSVNVSAG